MSDQKPQAYVGAQRKDGKYPVQFVYPLNGKRLHKVLTREKLDAIIAEGNYAVYGATR